MTDNRHGAGLTLDELRQQVADGRIHTVIVAMTDMQGRLQGKRFRADFFLTDVADHHAEGCSYMLTSDVDIRTLDGYAMSSWGSGYGDFSYVPDMQSLRTIPWHDGTALVLSDLAWGNGEAVRPSPRQILRHQLERLAERGLVAWAGTELEFLVFRDTYEEAWKKGYRNLEPANLYNVDYSLLDTARLEPLFARIRNEMCDAGVPVTDYKGECNYGQHEINICFDQALAAADNHVVYKNGVKEIAAQEGYAITFMPKFNEREGNSCHVHLSVRDQQGNPVMAGDGEHGESELFRHFLAGQLACLRDFSLFFAPNINSYKRYAKGSFAPTAAAWGMDNRTCALRVVGHGNSLRFENRVPGGDANPYLALAAMIAAGLHGLEHNLELEPELVGNAYTTDKPRVPDTLRDARESFLASDVAKTAFGEDIVQHYARMAEVEVETFDAAVTDWERVRSFERM